MRAAAVVFAALMCAGCTRETARVRTHEPGVKPPPAVDGLAELQLGMTEGQVVDTLSRSGTRFTRDGGATGYFPAAGGGPGQEITVDRIELERAGQPVHLELRNGILDSIVAPDGPHHP